MARVVVVVTCRARTCGDCPGVLAGSLGGCFTVKLFNRLLDRCAGACPRLTQPIFWIALHGRRRIARAQFHGRPHADQALAEEVGE